MVIIIGGVEKKYQQEMRRKLAQNITELLEAFTDDTGLTVKNIRVYVDQYTSGETEYHVVDLEISL